MCSAHPKHDVNQIIIIKIIIIIIIITVIITPRPGNTGLMSSGG